MLLAFQLPIEETIQNLYVWQLQLLVVMQLRIDQKPMGTRIISLEVIIIIALLVQK